MTTNNLGTKQLILKKMFIGYAKQHNPEYNENKMMKSIDLAADKVVNEMIKLRNNIIRKSGDKILDDYKKERRKKQGYDLILNFLLNKDKKYNESMQNMITNELDNEILKETVDLGEKNHKIVKYIPELEKTKIRAMYMEYVIDFSGQRQALNSKKKMRNNIN